MIFKPIEFWPDAFHVFDGAKRIGVVNRRTIRVNGRAVREMWFAHNRHFFSIQGEFATRTLAAEAIPKGVIHQRVDDFS